LTALEGDDEEGHGATVARQGVRALSHFIGGGTGVGGREGGIRGRDDG
jgi:hypothetical protein